MFDPIRNWAISTEESRCGDGDKITFFGVYKIDYTLRRGFDSLARRLLGPVHPSKESTSVITMDERGEEHIHALGIIARGPDKSSSPGFAACMSTKPELEVHHGTICRPVASAIDKPVPLILTAKLKEVAQFLNHTWG